MRKESDNIELRSEEIQDILTRPPHLIVRVGISVICSVILLLFAGCFFFKYPDIIEGEVLITTENPPVLSQKLLLNGKNYCTIRLLFLNWILRLGNYCLLPKIGGKDIF
jgi:hypothetical protein